jgi:hypothetical protein
LVLDIEPGPNGSDPLGLVAAGSRYAWFTAKRWPEAGLWRTDGTAQGTVLHDPAPTHSFFDPKHMTLSNGRLLMAGRTVTHGVELWSVTLGATAQPIGTGCGVGHRVPALRSTDPVLGGAIDVSGSDIGSQAIAFLFAGMSAPPLPWPSHECGFLIDPASALWLGDFAVRQGRFAAQFTVPDRVDLVGMQAVLQAVVWPSAGSRAADMSNGVLWTFGR